MHFRGRQRSGRLPERRRLDSCPLHDTHALGRAWTGVRNKEKSNGRGGRKKKKGATQGRFHTPGLCSLSMQTMIRANDLPNFTSRDGPPSCVTAAGDLSICPDSKFRRGLARICSHFCLASASNASGRACLAYELLCRGVFPEGGSVARRTPSRKARGTVPTVSITTT